MGGGAGHEAAILRGRARPAPVGGSLACLLSARGNAYVAPMNSISPWSELWRGKWPLLASLVAKAMSYGTVPIYIVGVFTLPLGAAFGWSRGQVALGFTLVTLTSATLAPMVGWLCDRYGARRLAILGTTGFGLGVSLVGLTASPQLDFLGRALASPARLLGMSDPSLLQFYVSWVLATAMGFGSSAIILSRFVVGWFKGARGLALGIMLTGSGLTAVFAPPLVAGLIENFDWRAGYFGLSAVILFFGVPVVALGLKDPPSPGKPDTAGSSAQGQASGGKAVSGGFRLALGSRAFWILLAAFCSGAFGLAGLIASFSPILQDAGYSLGQAGGLAGLIGVFVIVGRLGVGYLLDRLWAPGVAFATLSCGALTCGLLALPELSTAVVILAAFCLGLAAGAEWDALGYLTAREFGLASYGRVYSLAVMGVAYITAVGPPAFGWTFDLLGTYRPVLFVSMALFLAGPAMLLFLKRGPGAAEEE